MNNIPTSSVYWKKTESRTLPNLHVLVVNDKEAGIIYRPANTRTEKNSWRLYTGVGDNSNFIGHEWNKKVAMKAVEKHLGVIAA